MEYQIKWQDRNQHELRAFVAGDTGSKLVAHYRNNQQRLLREAMDEEDPAKALHKLAVAKGFSVALAIIDLSTEATTPQTEEYAEEEQKISSQFARIVSSPAIFR